MTERRRRSPLARLRSLLRGSFSLWMRDREIASPEAVYEQAIAERVRQYRDLKDAVAGILFLRTKLETEVVERRAEIARLHDDVRRAVRQGDDSSSLTLIAHKQSLFEDLERAEKELAEVRVQAGEAKGNLVRYREEIRSLVREKGRMLATLANAQARRRLQVAIEGLSVDAEMDALEGVREQISRLSVEEGLDKEIGDVDLRDRLRGYRDAARNDAARSELDQLKQEIHSHTLPSESYEHMARASEEAAVHSAA
jgi:phage shock protein A